MKNLICFLVGGIILSYAPLSADLETTVAGSEEMVMPQEEESHPFTFQIYGDNICKSKFKDSDDEGQISFNEYQVEFGIVYYYNPSCVEGANITLNYTRDELRWNENPSFDQEHFNTATIAFGGFTQRLCNWLWQAQVAFNIDTDHVKEIASYTTYDILLWGRYDYCQDLGIHVGFLAQTGLQIDRVYPVLGVDWTLGCNWKLNLIFPLNISLVYNITDNFSLALATRFFSSRHRVNEHEELERAVFAYRNGGLELAANYNIGSCFKFNVHGGYTSGGTLKIANRHNDHPHHYRFKSAPYYGGELTFSF